MALPLPKFEMRLRTVSSIVILECIFIVAFIPKVIAQSWMNEYCATSKLLNYHASMHATTAVTAPRAKTTAPVLGENRTFWDIERQLTATCRAVGEHCHELLHLIHWGQSRLNETWINEGCAEFAAYVCGYYEPGISDSVSYHYLSDHSNLSLTSFQSEMSYALTFTFMLYLSEKFGGIASIAKLLAEHSKGLDAINETLTSLNYIERFDDVFTSWQLAIFLDHINPVNPKYRLESIDTPPFKQIRSHNSYPFPSIMDSVESWAGQFIGFVGQQHVKVSLQGNPGLNFSLLSVHGSPDIVFDPIELNNAYAGGFELGQKDTVVLVVSNNANDPTFYTYEVNHSTSVTLPFENQAPRTFQLFQNVPNPFSGSTTIRLQSLESSRVKLTIFSVSGQKVRTLLDEEMPVGLHTVKWDGRSDNGQLVTSGLYFCVLETNQLVDSRKMILAF